jgi:hypothetical protein
LFTQNSTAERHFNSGPLSTVMIAALTLATTAAFTLATTPSTLDGPCDITTAAGNPCVAAHSTVRALYGAYDGPLYNVTRSSDNASTNIGLLNAGGFANIATHDAFCSKGDCVISNVFDQSPQGNHLGQRHKLVNASQHKIQVAHGAIDVYGMWFDPGYGYHVDNTTGIATGNEEESIYAVMSGTHTNGKCCFDYGNSETNDKDDGCGTMEAIYFGNAHWQGNSGDNSTSDGPWVGAGTWSAHRYPVARSPYLLGTRHVLLTVSNVLRRWKHHEGQQWQQSAAVSFRHGVLARPQRRLRPQRRRCNARQA